MRIVHRVDSSRTVILAREEITRLPADGTRPAPRAGHKGGIMNAIFTHVISRCVFGALVLGTIDACSASPGDYVAESAQAMETTSTEEPAEKPATAPPPATDASADGDSAATAGVKQHPNETFSLAGWILVRAMDKTKALEDLGAPPDVTQVPTARGTAPIAMGGNWIVVDKPAPGTSVGTDGAGPCVGVVIIAGDKVYAFHFGGTDDPVSTMAGAGPFPAGSHGVIVGGDGSNDSDKMLNEVIRALNRNGIKIDGYSNTNGIHVRDGKFINYKTDHL